MPQVCKACTHPERDRIDSAIVANETNRAIASRFNLTPAGVQRHAEKHLPALLVKAKEAESIASADTLLEQVQRAQTRVLGWLDAAEKDKDRKSLAPLSKELRGYFGLMGQLTGQLQTGPLVNVNMHGMGSPTVGALTEPELSIDQLAEVLASLPPADLAAALELTRQIHADNAEADRIADNALRVVPALGVPATDSTKAGAGQSLFQPGRQPGT